MPEAETFEPTTEVEATATENRFRVILTVEGVTKVEVMREAFRLARQARNQAETAASADEQIATLQAIAAKDKPLPARS